MVLDLVVDHELSHVDPATEEVISLALPQGHEFDAKAALNELCVDGFINKARHANSDTFRLTRAGLVQARRLSELNGLADRLLPQLSTLPRGSEATTLTWALLVERGAASAAEFFACLLLLRVLEIGDLVTVSVHAREAYWRITRVTPAGCTLHDLMNSPEASPLASAPKSVHMEPPPTDEHRLPSHEPSARYKVLKTWPGYVLLSEEFQGANGWLKLVLALLTIIPHLAPIKIKVLSLDVSLASLVYLAYHGSNMILFIKVKQAASHTAALASTKEHFDALARYNKTFVHRIGYVVYALIAMTIILKIWGQAGTPPLFFLRIAHWIGVPV